MFRDYYSLFSCSRDVIMQKFECNFECCGVRKKANEGEQIKKKRKQKGQFPRVFFSKRIQENFLREKRSRENLL